MWERDGVVIFQKWTRASVAASCTDLCNEVVEVLDVVVNVVEVIEEFMQALSLACRFAPKLGAVGAVEDPRGFSPMLFFLHQLYYCVTTAKFSKINIQERHFRDNLYT